MTPDAAIRDRIKTAIAATLEGSPSEYDQWGRAWMAGDADDAAREAAHRECVCEGSMPARVYVTQAAAWLDDGDAASAAVCLEWYDQVMSVRT